MGGAISGYWAIGSTRMAARPASAMKIESTAAKIGRSMKKRENIISPLLLVARRLGRFRPRLGPLLRGDDVRVADLHGGAGHHHHLHQSIGDDLVAGRDAREHDPLLRRPVA